MRRETVTLISEAPIDPAPPAYTADEGAVVQFLGVVREMEAGRPLSAIRYSCYRPMAESLLQTIVEQARTSFGEHSLYFHHRIGEVLVAEPSVIIRVGSGHSEPAFALCRHYVREMKTNLPIWKEALYRQHI